MARTKAPNAKMGMAAMGGRSLAQQMMHSLRLTTHARPSGSHHDLRARSLGHAGDRATVDDGVLDLALVCAPFNLEETLHAPVLIPAVCHQPVWGPVLHAPAQDLDCVAAEHRILPEPTRFVDAGLVRGEALVHKKHAGDGAVLVDLLLHGLRAVLANALLADAVASLAVVLARGPRLPVVHARIRTGRGPGVAVAVGVLRRVGVVSARLQLVGIAHGLVAKVAAIHNARALVVAVHGGRDAAVAAHVAEVAAGGDILSGKVHTLLALARDADAVRHGLH